MSNYYHNYQSKYPRTRGYYGELVQEGKLDFVFVTKGVFHGSLLFPVLIP